MVMASAGRGAGDVAIAVEGVIAAEGSATICSSPLSWGAILNFARSPSGAASAGSEWDGADVAWGDAGGGGGSSGSLRIVSATRNDSGGGSGSWGGGSGIVSEALQRGQSASDPALRVLTLKR
jgi:hypothetical protein